MKRRLLTLLLSVSIVLPLLALASCAPGEQSGDSDQEELTRGEWIAQLGDAFGMDNYATEEPYFEDVTEDAPYYPYVQAAADWGVLSAFTDADTLDPEEPVTYEEAAVMAALAAGWDLTEDQFLEDGTFDPSQAVAYAQEMGIMDPDTDPEERVTRSQGEIVTEAAKDVYLNAPVEEQANVVFNPDLVDFTNYTINWNVGPNGELSPSGGTVETEEDGTLTVTMGTTELQEGSVVILPGTPEYPSGIAYKIENIREEGGQIVFDTVTPTLEDLYDELDYQGTVTADPADIIWAGGLLRALPPPASRRRKAKTAIRFTFSPAEWRTGPIHWARSPLAAPPPSLWGLEELSFPPMARLQPTLGAERERWPWRKATSPMKRPLAWRTSAALQSLGASHWRRSRNTPAATRSMEISP